MAEAPFTGAPLEVGGVVAEALTAAEAAATPASVAAADVAVVAEAPAAEGSEDNEVAPD